MKAVVGAEIQRSPTGNRFASALLLRSTFATERRLALRGTRLNWAGASEPKIRRGVSKAAIIFRALQPGLFTEEQARAGFVGLNRHGEALREAEDDLIPNEEPGVIVESPQVLREHFGVPEAALAREMRVQHRRPRSGATAACPTILQRPVRPPGCATCSGCR